MLFIPRRILPTLPTTVTRRHWNTASTSYPLVTIANQYLYDHAGRKVKTWEQITNGSSSPGTKTLLSQLAYNEVGQLTNKQLHSTDSVSFLQNITYAYNERGWLLSSTAPLFAMQLQYNTASSGKQYNGNIANQSWVTPSLTDNYTYAYDKLNRLTSGKSNDNYIERGITYDLMGNITALNRLQANTLIDSLTYAYSSTNQLQSITDASGNNTGVKAGSGLAYAYDGNGNVTTDPSRNSGSISIAYNLLNLPQSITGGKTITYTYDAAGNKLRRISTGTGNTDYISGIEYDGTTTDTLNFIQTEEGRAVKQGNAYDYQYYLGDNLGNTRVTFGTKTGTAVLLQTDDYYPFGMEINRSVGSLKNEYLYNKKELQEELGQYDYGARFYDPVIARWNTIDPLAEISRRWSPYNYVENDPIRLTDPDGMRVKYNGENMTLDGEDAVNYGWGLKIGGETTQQGKDKDRADAKQSSKEKNNEKDVSTIKLLIAAPNHGKDVGHTAIQINNNVYGYYPTDVNGNGTYDMSELLNSPGQLEIINRQQFEDTYLPQGFLEIKIAVTKDQLKQLKANIAYVKANPGTYSLLTEQCTSVAASLLKSSNIQILIPSKMGMVPLSDASLPPAALRDVILSWNRNLVVGRPTFYEYKHKK